MAKRSTYSFEKRQKEIAKKKKKEEKRLRKQAKKDEENGVLNGEQESGEDEVGEE